MNKAKSNEHPSVADCLGVGERQMITYTKPSPRRTANKTSRRKYSKLPYAQQTPIWRIVMKSFIATPVAYHPDHEVTYFPSHGYSQIRIWQEREWFKFELNMGEGPITIPAGAAYTIRTFGCKVRLHAVATSKSWPTTIWEKSADELCKNKCKP